MAIENINSIIEQSTGIWSQNIQDEKYTEIKNAEENQGDDPAFSDNAVEQKLAAVNLPVNNQVPTKKQWLKRIVCEVLHDPETENVLENINVDNAKKKLLQIVLDKVVQLVPGLPGVALTILENVLVYLIKRALVKARRGIMNWCN